MAVLDSRLATASYRTVLLATLPPMRRTVERADVEEFLRRALAYGIREAKREDPHPAAAPSGAGNCKNNCSGNYKMITTGIDVAVVSPERVA